MFKSLRYLFRYLTHFSHVQILVLFKVRHTSNNALIGTIHLWYPACKYTCKPLAIMQCSDTPYLVKAYNPDSQLEVSKKQDVHHTAERARCVI